MRWNRWKKGGDDGKGERWRKWKKEENDPGLEGRREIERNDAKERNEGG